MTHEHTCAQGRLPKCSYGQRRLAQSHFSLRWLRETTVFAVVLELPYSWSPHWQSFEPIFIASSFASPLKSLLLFGHSGISQISFLWSPLGSVVKHHGWDSLLSGLRQ